MRGQGLLLGEDRGLLDRLSNEVRSRRLSDPKCDHPTRAGRHDLPLGSRQPISFQEGPAAPEEQRPKGSMGRVGSSGDNAAMENFFSLLQKNVLDTRRWETREDLRLAIVTWIETKYNRRRRQRRLGKLSPVALEHTSAASEAGRKAGFRAFMGRIRRDFCVWCPVRDRPDEVPNDGVCGWDNPAPEVI